MKATEAEVQRSVMEEKVSVGSNRSILAEQDHGVILVTRDNFGVLLLSIHG